MYWQRDWFEGRLRNVIERHQPALGYTTSLWFTARHAVPLFDHDGWLASMQAFWATLHPGEKRLADHVARLGDRLPSSFGHSVRRVLGATADPAGHGLLQAIDELCDTVEETVRRTAPA